MFFGIPSSEGWISVEPVNKGWSDDKKYLVACADGSRLLLRLSGADKLAEKEREFEIIGKFAKTGVRMSSPVGFGRCDDGRVFMLLTWLGGQDLEAALPTLPEDGQYRLGREAGEILKRLHSVPVTEAGRSPGALREKKLNQLDRYEASAVRVPGDEPVIRFVRENIGLVFREAPVCQHGDFHPGNLIWDGSGIGVIDFNRWDIGDPYEEFYKLESFGREVSIPYCRGQIDAYFDDNVPQAFWEALAVYSAHASLFSIKWAEKFGQSEIEGMAKRYRTAMEDYEGFMRTVPRWY